MRKNLRESCIIESSLALIALSLGATALFSSCSAKEDKDSDVGLNIYKIDKVSDISKKEAKDVRIIDNTSKFAFLDEKVDISKFTVSSANFMDEFEIYLDAEQKPFIISGNKLVEMKKDDNNMYLPFSENNHISIYNSKCGYLLYDSESYSKALTSVEDFLSKEIDVTTASEIPVVFNNDSDRMLMVKFQQIDGVSGVRSCFDLLNILDELKIEYEVQDNVIIAKRYNYTTKELDKVYIPLAEKGSIIRDTCSNGQSGTNTILACTYKDGETYYADRSTVYSVLGISIAEKYNGYVIQDNVGINLEMAVAEGVSIPECLTVSSDIEENPVTKVTIVESPVPDIEVKENDIELSDEEIIASNSDRDEDLCRRWGVVAQFGIDAVSNAKLLAEKMNEKYPQYHFSSYLNGVQCDDYVELMKQCPIETLTVEECNKAVHDWLGDDWTTVKSKSFDELMEYSKYFIIPEVTCDNPPNEDYMYEVICYINSRMFACFRYKEFYS